MERKQRHDDEAEAHAVLNKMPQSTAQPFTAQSLYLNPQLFQTIQDTIENE